MNNFFSSYLGNIQLFFIDENLNVPESITIHKTDALLFFQTQLGIVALTLMDCLCVFIQKNRLLISVNTKRRRKDLLNLYTKLIQLKIKGVLRGFKISLILKGIGFKCAFEKNTLRLKLGFSHDVSIIVPEKIKILASSNRLIFYSVDYIFLHQFVYTVKNLKKPEPYKGKGFLFKDEKIVLKEGKRGKK